MVLFWAVVKEASLLFLELFLEIFGGNIDLDESAAHFEAGLGFGLVGTAGSVAHR